MLFQKQEKGIQPHITRQEHNHGPWVGEEMDLKMQGFGN